jgi:hypothetical protein
VTTLNDLYPDGAGYHRAHEAYIDTVAAALEAAGFVTDVVGADPNDPRDGWIGFDMDAQPKLADGGPVWLYDEAGAGWSEDRGWHLLLIDQPDSRFVDELGIARVASPETVVRAVAEKAGLTVDVPACRFSDADFPEHTFEDDDVPFEQALAVYRGVS